jgi:mannose-6-phosphate isomerase-like protein (cupin superfamily)
MAAPSQHCACGLEGDMGDGAEFVIRASDAPATGRTDGGSFRLVQRDQLGLGEISVGVSDNPPGADAFVHRHSCGEVFVVYEGRGIYTVGDTEVIAGPGDMVVVAPGTWHSFRPAGEEPLRHVAVYDSGHIDIELASGRVIPEV